MHIEPTDIHGFMATVSDESLAVLDAFEGTPDHYRREEVTVLVDGQQHRAFVYIAADQTDRGAYGCQVINGLWSDE